MSGIISLHSVGIPHPKSIFNLEIEQDKRVVFLTGHNGTGKTNLLKAIHESICCHHRMKEEINKGESSFKLRQNFAILLDFNQSRKLISVKKIYENLKLSPEEIYTDNEKFYELMNNVENSPEHDIKKNMKDIGKKLYLESQTVNESYKSLNLGQDNIFHAEVLNQNNLGKEIKIPNSLFFSYDDINYSSENIISRELFQSIDLNKIKLGELTILDFYLYLVLVAYSNIPTKEESEDNIIKRIKDIFKDNNVGENDKIAIMLSDIIKEQAKEKEKIAINFVLEILNDFFKETSREIIMTNDSNLIACKLIETGDIVPWKLLSKGEKSLLLLCFTIYLYSTEDIIFLIDEPELSLHINWQEKLVPNLLKLSSKAQFIIATHAPSIIMKTEEEQYFNLEFAVNEV